MVSSSDENSRPEKLPDENARDRAVSRGVEIAEKDLQDAGGAYNRDELTMILPNDTLREVDHLVVARAILEIRDADDQLGIQRCNLTEMGLLSQD